MQSRSRQSSRRCRCVPPELVAGLFEPLGYAVEVTEHLLDPQRPDWGKAPYVTLRLQGIKRLSELLTHLYVLMPVLDDRKHYFIDQDEVAKLRHEARDGCRRTRSAI